MQRNWSGVRGREGTGLQGLPVDASRKSFVAELVLIGDLKRVLPRDELVEGDTEGPQVDLLAVALELE